MRLVDLVNGDVLIAIAKGGSLAHQLRAAGNIQGLGPALAAALSAGSITTPLRIAHFLAQIAHESDGFAALEEYASGSAYEGRADLGNTQAGDGPLFKGRSPIMLTGRANYRAAGADLGVDLEGSPQLAAKPDIALRIAVWFWNSRTLSPIADRDDLVTITRRINGGTNGLASRRAYLAKAKAAIAGLQASLIAPDPGQPPTLRRGSDEPAVALLQESLQRAGYRIAIDGDFGPATELAVRQFQIAHPGLTVDGIVGPATWRALAAFAPPASRL